MHIYRKKFDYIEIEFLYIESYFATLKVKRERERERGDYNSIDLVSEKVQ